MSKPPQWFKDLTRKALEEDAKASIKSTFKRLPFYRKVYVWVRYLVATQLHIWDLPNHTVEQRIAWMKGTKQPL